MSNNLFYDRKGNCLQFHKSETNSFEVVCPAAGRRRFLSRACLRSPSLPLSPSNYCSFQAVGMSRCQAVRCQLPQDLTSWVWMGEWSHRNKVGWLSVQPLPCPKPYLAPSGGGGDWVQESSQLWASGDHGPLDARPAVAWWASCVDCPCFLVSLPSSSSAITAWKLKSLGTSGQGTGPWCQDSRIHYQVDRMERRAFVDHQCSN